MLNAPIWVTLLIAAADETIDRSEINKAKDVIAVRAFAEQGDLKKLYKEVSNEMDQAIQRAINELPLDGEERVAILSEKLEGLNTILPKLDKVYAINYVESLTRLASIVAQSEGGLFGIGSISHEEAALKSHKKL